MFKDAELSDDGIYRYSLRRIWDEKKPLVLFICLNPSTADDSVDDPTTTRCIEYAKNWGYGGVLIGNLFAFRATAPENMMQATDPVGPDNDDRLSKLGKESELVVAAWGNEAEFMPDRIEQVKSMFSHLHYLHINKTGQPRHPLYCDLSLQPKPILEPFNVC